MPYRCRQWLELHLLKSYTIALLRDIKSVCYTQCTVNVKLTIPCMHSMELLVDLLKSPDLYVMQVEMDVYTLAKRVGLYP